MAVKAGIACRIVGLADVAKTSTDLTRRGLRPQVALLLTRSEYSTHPTAFGANINFILVAARSTTNPLSPSPAACSTPATGCAIPRSACVPAGSALSHTATPARAPSNCKLRRQALPIACHAAAPRCKQHARCATLGQHHSSPKPKTTEPTGDRVPRLTRCSAVHTQALPAAAAGGPSPLASAGEMPNARPSN